jgi:cytochrome c553
MKFIIPCLSGLLLSMVMAAPADLPPSWAYGFPDAAVLPGPPRPASQDPTVHTLPGSTLQFTREQVANRFGPADWYPQDHPVMPDIVAHGKPPDVIACSLCHYPNGKGRPENSTIAGLTVNYFIEQVNAFRQNERITSDPRKTNTNLMATIAKGMTGEEIRQAAQYYASMKFGPWVTVVETTTVPTTTTSVGLFLPVGNGEQEPLGSRIIEVPQNVEAVENLRSPRVGFIAYAPIGSLRKGQALVTNSGGHAGAACAQCHGTQLQGMGDVPAIAGRSPSYLVRQMFDIKSGHRTGLAVQQMKPVMANLDPDDMLAVAAYVSSLNP